ncbi:hypothetical protein G5I_05299 [Acromyrmex echinatior]|uniref:Uncharacterized protein n=1 Tax=Acromyrmex echinatior TaxID=103372 RepID=F4WHV2_ACREC|nr:hypothetical protein G5I_05299 [Acromyrmex echinatior]
MSTNRLRRTETPQRLAPPVSTPTSGSNTTLPRPYGSHTDSVFIRTDNDEVLYTPCDLFPYMPMNVWNDVAAC